MLFTLEILYPLLREWHKVVQERNVLSNSTSGEDFSTGSEEREANAPSTSAAETPLGEKRFGRMCTFGKCFAFSNDENVRSEIDAVLLNIAYKISLDYKKKNKGRTRKELDNRVRKFHVMEGQAKSVQEL